MKIYLAKHSGFCMGVKKAVLRIVSELNSSKENIQVFGPLIHNPQTIEVLQNRGMETIKDLDNIQGETVAIRSHGIPIDQLKKIKGKSKRVINLTCPRVAKVQAIIKKYSGNGYFTIIIGDKDHAEVSGLKSYASQGFQIVSNPGDIHVIPQRDKYLIVAQTTLDRNFFYDILKTIKKTFKNLEIVDTICDSTRNRQKDILDGIKNGIDTIIVIGGRNSANTKRLVQISIDHGLKTLHIETEEELKLEDFLQSEKVLVTAGASTPGWIINNVLEKLYNIKFKKTNIIINLIKNFIEFIIKTNILSSSGAFFFTLIAQYVLNLTIDYKLPFIAAMYIFSMYSINNYMDRGLLKISNPYKYKIYSKYGKFFFLIALFSMTASIYLSLQYTAFTIMLIGGAYLLGFIYSIKQIKNIIQRLDISILNHLYNTKIVTSLGWVLITVGIPLSFYGNISIYTLTILLYVFTFIFLRNVLIDIIAFQGDYILGKETLLTWIGLAKVNIISMSLLSITVLILVYTSIIQNMLFLLFTINLIYYMILLLLITRRNFYISLKYEMLVDCNFILLMIINYLL